MSKEREALKLALEALEVATTPLAKDRQEVLRAITAIREALADHIGDANKMVEQSTCKQALQVEQPAQQQEPVRLRRGNILRCIETDELCTVWSTSTTGKTLVKWNANEFGAYTAEQIGELFWLEPEPDDLELAAEKSDNYAAFHAGYRFAVAHFTPPASKPWVGLTRDERMSIINRLIGQDWVYALDAIEAKLKDKNEY